MNLNVNVKDLTTDLLVRYGFQVLGAIVILAIGFLLARWLAKTADRRFQKQQMEPPMRLLMVRVIKIVVLLMAFVVALDKFGFSIAPLVAGIGVAGLGVGFALQGVLGNLMAGFQAASQVAAQNARVLKSPAPSVGIDSMDDNGIKLALWAWVHVTDVFSAEPDLYP